MHSFPCPSCQRANPASARFCNACGSPLNESEETVTSGPTLSTVRLNPVWRESWVATAIPGPLSAVPEAPADEAIGRENGPSQTATQNAARTRRDRVTIVAAMIGVAIAAVYGYVHTVQDDASVQTSSVPSSATSRRLEHGRESPDSADSEGSDATAGRKQSRGVVANEPDSPQVARPSGSDPPSDAIVSDAVAVPGDSSGAATAGSSSLTTKAQARGTTRTRRPDLAPPRVLSPERTFDRKVAPSLPSSLPRASSGACTPGVAALGLCDNRDLPNGR